MAKNKYALLDTDFVSKTHLIRKDEHNRLIDLIMGMSNYRFFCHEQIRTELANHPLKDVRNWLDKKVKSKAIILYDDKRILQELTKVYKKNAAVVYADMIKKACEAYSQGYFEQNFVRVSQGRNLNIGNDEFLRNYALDCKDIGQGHNIGEIKSYVLLQVLQLVLGEQIYVFCSDDKDARNGVIHIGGVRCISVASSFLRLQREIGFTGEEAKPYIESYLKECIDSKQKTFKVQDTSKERRVCKVPCEQVFEEMFCGKIEETKAGTLRYVLLEPLSLDEKQNPCVMV